ncbi:DUF4412 domain-containing protein [bacterium]|nr:DUF4412 domain-containing protein [bacterium]
MKRLSLLLLAVLSLIIVLNTSALAFNEIKKELSADQVLTSPYGPEQRSKMYMAKKMSRWDDGQRTSIVRWDKNVMWIINHSDKTYFESPLDPDKVPVNLKDMEKATDRKKLGNETVEGRKCEKYQIKVNMKEAMSDELAKEKDEGFKKFMSQMKTEMTFLTWIDPDLGVAVKTQMDDGTVTLLKNIQVGTQNKGLFELPSGYKKVSSPAYGTLPGGPKMPPGHPKDAPPGFTPPGKMPPDMQNIMKDMGGKMPAVPEDESEAEQSLDVTEQDTEEESESVLSKTAKKLAKKLKPAGDQAKQVLAKGSFQNDAALATDGKIPEEGGPWNGDDCVYWESEDVSIVIDLGQVKTIQSITIQVDNNDDYVVEVSRKGRKYETLFTITSDMGDIEPGMDTFSSNPGDPQYDSAIAFDPVKARYVRLRALSGDGAYAVSEIQIN